MWFLGDGAGGVLSHTGLKFTLAYGPSPTKMQAIQGVRDLCPQCTAGCSAPGTGEDIQKTFVKSFIKSSTQQIFVEHLSVPGTSVNQSNMNAYPSEAYMLVKRERETNNEHHK